MPRCHAAVLAACATACVAVIVFSSLLATSGGDAATAPPTLPSLALHPDDVAAFCDACLVFASKHRRLAVAEQSSVLFHLNRVDMALSTCLVELLCACDLTQHDGRVTPLTRRQRIECSKSSCECGTLR
jgi:hypothetical protein